MPAQAGIKSGRPRLHYDIYTRPTVSGAQARRAFRRRTRREYRVSKRCRLTNYNYYAIIAIADPIYLCSLVGARPMHPRILAFMLAISRLVPNSPSSRCYFVDTRPSLIIRCKYQQKTARDPFRTPSEERIVASRSAFCRGTGGLRESSIWLAPLAKGSSQ